MVRRDATDEEILDGVREWVALLAAGDFASASSFLHLDDDAFSMPWTPERLEDWIANYGFDEPLDGGRRMRVTPIETAVGDLPPRFEVLRDRDEPPEVEFDLPLNGEWSDLTAIFKLAEVDGGWALTLYDLHVL